MYTPPLHLVYPIVLVVILLITPGCDSTNEESDPLQIETGPADGLAHAVEEDTSDFSWELFNQGIDVRMRPGVGWSRSTVVRIEAFQFKNGEVARDTSTSTTEVSGDALSEGVTSEELFSDATWIPGNEWSRSSTIRLEGGGPTFSPDTFATPSQREMVDLARSRTDLTSEEMLIGVYLVLPKEENPLEDREVQVRPYGVIFETE